VELWIKQGHRCDGAERKEGQAPKNAEHSRKPAQFILRVV
jgi:hypothetical protein